MNTYHTHFKGNENPPEFKPCVELNILGQTLEMSYVIIFKSLKYFTQITKKHFPAFSINYRSIYFIHMENVFYIGIKGSQQMYAGRKHVKLVKT